MESTPIDALKAAVGMFESQAAFARAIGRSQPTVWEALKRGTIPAEWCLAIERATDGKITRHQLRPDLYPLDESETTQ